MPDFLFGLLITATAVYAGVLVFLISGVFRLGAKKVSQRPKVSVVVAARNEEKNLTHCLKALTGQTYPREQLEIVVVDDRSTDRTVEILRRYKSLFPKLLTILSIQKVIKGVSPKKHALTHGIERASGELIFTTDADCTPSPNWVSETVPLFGQDIGLVIGPAPFTDGSNLWNKMLCLDNLAKELVAAGGAGWNVGVTCTGRNLAYRKELFEEANGFERITHSLSGDDDLFLQHIKKRTRWKITHSLSLQTSVFTPSVDKFSAFVLRHRRHISAGKHYTRALQTAYLLFNLANLYLFGFLITGFFVNKYLNPAIVGFILKLMLDFVGLLFIANKLRNTGLLLWWPLWEIFFILNQTLLSPWGFVGKIRWK